MFLENSKNLKTFESNEIWREGDGRKTEEPHHKLNKRYQNPSEGDHKYIKGDKKKLTEGHGRRIEEGDQK
jgi:hypothetical protein